MSFIYAFTDTRWSVVGTTYNGIWLDLSNGAGGSAVGAAASRPFKISNNGTSIFDCDLSGNVTSATYRPTATTPTANAQAFLTNTNATFAVAGTLSVQSNSIAAFAVVDKVTPAKGIFFGYQLNTDVGYIQAIQQGVANRLLCLNPEGGNVAINSGSNNNGSGLFVTGVIESSAGIRINVAPTANGSAATTITNGADSSTNLGHRISFNLNGTTYWIPCGATAF